ncbi:MAG: DUF4145 domain-containing protein [Geminicoccaceae bacterium]
MPVLVECCPRCGAERMTFDVTQALPIGIRYDWQRWYELFCICRNCRRSTTFIAGQEDIKDKALFASAGALLDFDRSLNDHVRVEGYVSLSDTVVHGPPEYVPPHIQTAFKEGATCLAVQCWNAAGTMFRMCVDLATRSRLPSGEEEGLNTKTRRDLGLRLQWLFERGYLPSDLRELSTCIREDGNDGAHAGTLTKQDAEDLLDFTRALLERLYTEPQRLRLAEERRRLRREG